MPTDRDTYLHKVASAPVKEDVPPADTQPFDTVTATDAVNPPKNVLPGELVTSEEDEPPEEFAPSESELDAPAEPEADAAPEAEVAPEGRVAPETEVSPQAEIAPQAETEPEVEAGTGPEPTAEAASESELRGRLAAEVQPGDSYGRRGAGELSEPDEPAEPTLLADGAATREKWMRLQASFVDDPRAAVTEGAALVADVLAQLEAAVRGRQQPGGDTEALRLQMRQYRRLVDRLTGL